MGNAEAAPGLEPKLGMALGLPEPKSQRWAPEVFGDGCAAAASPRSRCPAARTGIGLLMGCCEQSRAIPI